MAKLEWTDLDRRATDTARVLAADAVEKAGNGHPGTAISIAPLAYTLFNKVMRHDPSDPSWLGRDRFVLSIGHASLAQYCQLYLAGADLELDDLKSLRTWGAKCAGHPEYGHTRFVECTTGPLGAGISNAVGMAMAARRERGLFDPDAPEVTPATGGRALHIIDPRTSRGRVLSERFDPCDCHGHGAERFFAQGNGVEELRDVLDAGAGKIARLLMIGHCATGTRDAADTVFFMGDGEANKLRASRLVREAGRWSMPPRVGVVACASGTDLTQHEPFGLGTALLINGAEVVHATLWPLPTDHAIRLVNSRAVGAFGWLAQAVDHAQSDADPVASLCDLQRRKLAAWRERPGLGSSPLLWGALIAMTAPAGRRCSPSST